MTKKTMQDIHTFVASLEAQVLSEGQDSLLLASETSMGGGRRKPNDGECGHTANTKCKNKLDCSNSANRKKCQNDLNCHGSNNTPLCAGNDADGTGRTEGSTPALMTGFPGIKP